MESEMDVSRIDPEQVLVDAENVEIDLSVEMDEREVRSLLYGQEDKVHVSVRYVINSLLRVSSKSLSGCDLRIRTWLG